jgi:hypothetical protein
MVSDHCPLILQGETDKPKFKGFKSKSYWLAILGFLELVKQVWDNPLQGIDPVQRLHIKPSHTTKALKKWEKSCIGNLKMQHTITKEVIWLLDQAQERRALSHEEVGFRSRLKEIYLGLVTMEKIKARQRSRMTNIKYGDSNTKFFFLRANGRKRKKHIQFLHTEEGLAISHEDKAREIERHFGEVLGTKQARTTSLSWNVLDYPTFNLAEMDDEISQEEIKKAIAGMPEENAPSPDGFIGAFYNKCWDIIKGEITATVLQLSQLRGGTFNLLNTAHIVLLPKKEQSL